MQKGARWMKVKHSFILKLVQKKCSIAFLNLSIDMLFFVLTDHRPQPVPPSQSECESFGPQGPPAPSDTSGCCCSCWGNQERQSGRR